MDCTAVAIAALKLIGITLATIPQVVPGEGHGHGEYRPGFVYVRDAHDCRVVLHEFVHHKQYLTIGRMPRNLSEYFLWEREAAMLTMYAMAEYEESQQGKGQ